MGPTFRDTRRDLFATRITYLHGDRSVANSFISDLLLVAEVSAANR